MLQWHWGGFEEGVLLLQLLQLMKEAFWQQEAWPWLLQQLVLLRVLVL